MNYRHLCLTGLTASQNVYGVAFNKKSAGQVALLGRQAQVNLVDVGDGFAHGADQMMVRLLIPLHAQRSVMLTDLAQNPALYKQMNVFINGCKGDGRNAFANPMIDILWTGMARHLLHDLIENLTLVRHRQPMPSAHLAKRIGNLLFHNSY